MYTTLKYVHSGWAFIVLLIVILATFNALIGFLGNKEYKPKDFRISLFALIVTHLQFLIAAILYFISPNGLKAITNNGMGEVMKNEALRLLAVEHPIIMLITIIFITIGYSKHKKKLVSKPKFKILTIFYTIALLLMLSRVPWCNWLHIGC